MVQTATNTFYNREQEREAKTQERDKRKETNHAQMLAALQGSPMANSESLKGGSVQFSSVTQSCPTLCDPMNRSTPGLPVHHQLRSLPKLKSIESVMPSNHLTLFSFSSCLQSFPTSGSYQMSQLFASGGQNIGVSASTSVLPMNTQD